MMRKHFFEAGLAVMLVLVFSFTCLANEQTTEVGNLLKTKIKTILGILSEPNLPKAEKREQIMATINPVINFSLMAKLALGKRNWSRLSPEERSRFVGLFVNRLKTSYLDKTSLYSDLTVTYDKPVEEGGKISAPTHLKTKDGLIEVIYKFYSSNGKWQVYDVEIDGVSFIKSYRSQFDEVLKNGTVADLFAELNKTKENGDTTVKTGSSAKPEASVGK